MATSSAAAIRLGPPLADASTLVVAVHGRDQDPTYLIDHLVGPWDEATGGSVAWTLPAAPGRSWYPQRLLAPLAENVAGLDAALAVLDEIAADAGAAGVPAARIVWAGFSQGACVVTEWVARHPQRWGGLVVFTGARLGPSGTSLRIEGRFDAMPAYFGVGEHDDQAPQWRIEETVAAFSAAGAAVAYDAFPDGDHMIRAAEIERAVTHLGR